MSVIKRKDGDVEITTITGVDLEALKDNLAQQAWGDPPPAGHCRSCKKPFSNENVFSAAGWAETKLSGMCNRW